MAPCARVGSHGRIEDFSKILRVDIRMALAVPSGPYCRELAAVGRGGMLVRHGARSLERRVVVHSRAPVRVEALLQESDGPDLGLLHALCPIENRQDLTQVGRLVFGHAATFPHLIDRTIARGSLIGGKQNRSFSADFADLPSKLIKFFSRGSESGNLGYH